LKRAYPQISSKLFSSKNSLKASLFPKGFASPICE